MVMTGRTVAPCFACSLSLQVTVPSPFAPLTPTNAQEWACQCPVTCEECEASRWYGGLANVTQRGLNSWLGDCRIDLTKRQVYFPQQLSEAGKDLDFFTSWDICSLLSCCIGQSLLPLSGLSFSIYKMGSIKPLTRTHVQLSNFPVQIPALLAI